MLPSVPAAVLDERVGERRVAVRSIGWLGFHSLFSPAEGLLLCASASLREMIRTTQLVEIPQPTEP